MKLDETKMLIKKELELDEGNLKKISPKRPLLSEEIGSEGFIWSDIINEGRQKEEQIKAQEQKSQESDKALLILVPETTPSVMK